MSQAPLVETVALDRDSYRIPLPSSTAFVVGDLVMAEHPTTGDVVPGVVVAHAQFGITVALECLMWRGRVTIRSRRVGAAA